MRRNREEKKDIKHKTVPSDFFSYIIVPTSGPPLN